jgi:hypothetical protein
MNEPGDLIMVSNSYEPWIYDTVDNFIQIRPCGHLTGEAIVIFISYEMHSLSKILTTNGVNML